MTCVNCEELEGVKQSHVDSGVQKGPHAEHA